MKGIPLVALAVTIFAVFRASADVAYEQYLIPSTANNLPGSFGSVWRADLALLNTSEVQHLVVGPFCDPAVANCGSAPMTIDANTGTAPNLRSQSALGDGGFLYISKPASDIVSEFRVRDLSRQAQTWGTELPVVPTSSFRQRIDLLDVPADARFRLTLRIYSTNAVVARIHTISFPGQIELGVQDVQLVGPPALGQPLNLTPAYAQLALPTISSVDRIRLQIEQVSPGGAPLWAFVTITNNDTQQVTAVTPQFDLTTTPLPMGHWAGNAMCFDVDTVQAKIVYQCSVGTFAIPVVAPDGHFDADGTWTTSLGPSVSTVPAHVSGLVQGSSLIVTVRASGGAIGPLTVQLGGQGPCGGVCP